VVIFCPCWNSIIIRQQYP